MRNTEVILLVAFLGAYLVGWATADGNESNAYILSPEAREELVAFVNEAKDFVHEVGQDKAMDVFNDPKGKFVRGELFINAHDTNGTILANPYQPETIGQNLLNDTDPNGVAFVKILHDSDKRGGGFVYAIRPNPAHSNAQELKLFYSLEVDERLGLTSGMYLPGQALIFSNESRKDLVAFVENARDFALNHTKDEALKAFNDRNGEFVRGKRYIFAYDFEGNTLALPFEPELIGTNRIEFRDPNGAYSVQAVLDVAKRGSGFAYAIYQDPAENMTSKLKLDYVTNVDDKWFLGSGIYWPEG
jgi:polar amino acid transport system substrate-binding protein